MKAGTENRTKTIAAGVLGACALVGVAWFLYNQFSDSTPTPPPAIAPIARNIGANNAALAEPTPATAIANTAASRPAAMPTGNAAGVAAKKMAKSSASLDPTLDQSAMLRTEHLVYAGSGRNIFSAVYVPPPMKTVVAVNKFPPRPPPQPPPVVDNRPPPPPPIPLKFFGTATRANGTKQAFLLQGDDVFLASEGDIVARRYRIVSISNNSLRVEDMGNNNTQTLPLQN